MSDEPKTYLFPPTKFYIWQNPKIPHYPEETVPTVKQVADMLFGKKDRRTGQS